MKKAESVIDCKAKGMAIYTLRTTSGREDIVADMMLSKIRAENLDVRAIVHPAELKGYIFIEGNLADIHKAIHSMLHIRGLMERPVKMEEIQHFLDTKKARIVVDKSDIVEIVGGPFKGERGKIQRIDKAKDEVTVELLEASVPIPVTIATEFVKLVKRAKGRKEEAKPAEGQAPREEDKAPVEAGLPGAEEIRKGLAEKPEEEKSVFDIEESPGKEAPKEEEKPAEAQKEREQARKEEVVSRETRDISASKAKEEMQSPQGDKALGEEPSVLEEAQKKSGEFEAPETPEEADKLTEPVTPKEEPEEKPEAEAPEKKVIKRDEPVIMESEEDLEKPLIPQEEPEKEKPEEEEDSLLADLKKEKKKKSPEDLEEGE